MVNEFAKGDAGGGLCFRGQVVCSGVDTVGKHDPGIVTALTGGVEIDVGVGAKGDALLFALPVEAEVPEFAAGGFDA
nr:hypothetical protein [Chania multitudinisentens]